MTESLYNSFTLVFRNEELDREAGLDSDPTSGKKRISALAFVMTATL